MIIYLVSVIEMPTYTCESKYLCHFLYCRRLVLSSLSAIEPLQASIYLFQSQYSSTSCFSKQFHKLHCKYHPYICLYRLTATFFPQSLSLLSSFNILHKHLTQCFVSLLNEKNTIQSDKVASSNLGFQSFGPYDHIFQVPTDRCLNLISTAQNLNTFMSSSGFCSSWGIDALLLLGSFHFGNQHMPLKISSLC